MPGQGCILCLSNSKWPRYTENIVIDNHGNDNVSKISESIQIPAVSVIACGIMPCVRSKAKRNLHLCAGDQSAGTES